MLTNNKIRYTDLLIFFFIIGSVVLDSGDNLMKLIKVLFVIPCFANICKSHKLNFDTYVKWMLCFAAFAGLSFLWALSISNAAYRYQTVILNFICSYCLIVYITDYTDRIDLIFKTLLLAPIILEMRVVVSYGLFAFANTRSLDGIMSPNAIGMRAGIAAVLGIYFLTTKKKHRILYLLIISLNAAIMVLSASRKAILFMLIPLILYYIFSQENRLKFIRNVLLATGLVCVTYYGIMNISFVYDMVGYRVESMIYGMMGIGKPDASTSLRLTMIKWGIEWFQTKPLIGYGINNYMNLLGTMKTSFGAVGSYAHNNYIELLVDLGVIGTGIYYFIYLKMLAIAIHIRKRLATLQLIMVCILIAIIVNEYGMVTYTEMYVQIMLVLTWILLSTTGEGYKKESDYAIEQSRRICS